MWTRRSQGSSTAPALSTAPLLCALTLLLAACEATDHGPVTPAPPGNPQPAFEQLPDGVALSVASHVLSAGASRRVAFSGPAYGIRITVTGHSRGTLVFDLRDEYGTIQRHDRISCDTTIVDSGRTFNRPGFVDAAFTDFTGRVDLTLRDVGSVTEMPIFQFPRAAGTTWTYARETEAGGGPPVRDTVVITARPDTLVSYRGSGQRLYGLWEVRATTGGGFERCDVLLYLEEDGFAFLRLSLGSPWGNDYATLADASKLRFPLRRGSRWLSGYPIGFGVTGYYTSWPLGLYIGTAGVVSVSPVTVAGASFPEGYRVYQYWHDPDTDEEVVYHEYLIVPNVGIVGMKTHVPLYCPREVWELISYSIPGGTR